jgi:hypothetical protein
MHATYLLSPPPAAASFTFGSTQSERSRDTWFSGQDNVQTRTIDVYVTYFILKYITSSLCTLPIPPVPVTFSFDKPTFITHVELEGDANSATVSNTRPVRYELILDKAADTKPPTTMAYNNPSRTGVLVNEYFFIENSSIETYVLCKMHR